MIEFVDGDDRRDDSHTLTHKILKRIRECEKYNIDYEEYINRRDLIECIEILDCCLKHKDNPKIARRDYEV